MFITLLKKLFGWTRSAKTGGASLIVEAVDGELDDGRVPGGKMLCVFSAGTLAAFYRNGDGPANRRNGEEWWLVPGADVPFELTLPVGEASVTTTVAVRFDPETELLLLIDGREFLTREDIVSLITSQLTGLVDMLGYEKPSQLAELGVADMERLRAKLSLLLQTRGMRCTDLGRFELLVSAKPQAETGETDAERLPESFGDDLTQVVSAVESEEDWEGLVSTLEDAGGSFDESSIGELQEIGTSVVGRKADPRQVASRLQTMTELARKRAGVVDPDLRRWRGLDMRLAGADSDEGEESERIRGPGAPAIRKKRRPWTWWMIRRRAVDERLLRFLRHTMASLRHQFDTYRGSQDFGRSLVNLRRVDQRLGMTLDLLETIPTTAPPQGNLRPDREKLKQLVKSVEAAVTAAETAQAEVRAMHKESPGSDEWTESCTSVCSALDHLTAHLRSRRQIR
ncbi:MAG: hypothetical protein IID45_10140 [Planctomycetes bacterium]|nr:hypothetical protein [Planctomycetota bacterium]